MKLCGLLFLLVPFSSWCYSPSTAHPGSFIPEPDTSLVNKLIASSEKAQWTDPYFSLDFADQALKAATTIDYKKGMASAHNLKGFCFWAFGDNDLAIQAALDALNIAEAKHYRTVQAESYYILARAYMDLNENIKARESIARAEVLARGSNNWEQLCSIYNLRGVIFFIDNKVDSALYFYNQALETGKAHAVDAVHFPRIISNIGECHAIQNPAVGFNYFNEALALAKQTGNKVAEASITDVIGHAYLRKKDIQRAETHLQNALQLGRALGLRRVIRHAYAGLVDIKLQQGRGDEAVVYLRRYYAVRDSLLNTSKIRQIVELEAKHDLELKEQQIQVLEAEKRIQIMWNNILIALIIFLIILSVALYLLQQYRYRKNRKILDLEIDKLTQSAKKTPGDQHPVMPEQTSDEPVESYDQKLLKKAISVVEANIGDPLFSVEKMAMEMNMSRTSLHRKIKSITSFPPSELIRSIRLRKAARLILNKVDSISQISILVGFDDYSHFSKAFKKHFGVSPSAYEASKTAQPVESESDEPVVNV